MSYLNKTYPRIKDAYSLYIQFIQSLMPCSKLKNPILLNNVLCFKFFQICEVILNIIMKKYKYFYILHFFFLYNVMKNIYFENKKTYCSKIFFLNFQVLKTMSLKIYKRLLLK